MIEDFVRILDTLATLYKSLDDKGRASTFENASANISKYSELVRGKDEPTVDEIRGIKGIGPSIAKMYEEFVRTSECERLNTLLQSCEFDEDVYKRAVLCLADIREKQIKRMKEPPRDKAEAKAFFVADHPYVKKALSAARKQMKSIDGATKVFMAHALREDGFLPYEWEWIGERVCDECVARMDEMDYCCSCEVRELERKVSDLGCSFILR